VLTAIVIGFALTVILASIALRAWREHGTLSSDAIRSAERLGDPFASDDDDAR
jgi:multicomponent Na+:H+ antiporter subunit C